MTTRFSTIIPPAALFVALITTPYLAMGQQNEEKPDSAGGFWVWLAYQSYTMDEFNTKLRNEDNNEIDTGLSAGLEFGAAEVDVKWVKVTIPLGLEFLGASSKTTHTDSAGSTLVTWTLPVTGAYVAPTVRVLSGRLYLQPIGVGLYLLGRIAPARLTVSDRPGELKAKGETVGVTSQIGYVFGMGPAEVIVSAGRRWLSFTDVALEPKGDFPPEVGGFPTGVGTLPEALDYGGMFLRVRIGFLRR